MCCKPDLSPITIIIVYAKNESCHHGIFNRVYWSNDDVSIYLPTQQNMSGE